MKTFLFFLGIFILSSTHAQELDSPKPQAEAAVYDKDVIDLDAMNSPSFERANYPGGEQKFYQFISDQVKYPTRCMDEGISGKVVVRFTVNKNGELSNFKPMKTVAACPEFTHETIRILKRSKRWNPGKKDGLPINSYFEIPLMFNMQ